MCDGYLLRSCASGAFAVRLHGGVSLHFRAVDHRFGTYPCHQRNTVLPFPRPEGRGCHQVLGEDLHRDVRVRLGHGHHDGVLLRNDWADYSRFVGDIFGAPLAAEALLAFFLESTFLGVLLFGRRRVSPKFRTWVSGLARVVRLGSVGPVDLIANSWMQTPAGAELSADGSKAVITDFLTAAMNPSVWPRYSHTIVAVLIMGAFVAMAVSAWYLIKNRHKEFA